MLFITILLFSLFPLLNASTPDIISPLFLKQTELISSADSNLPITIDYSRWDSSSHIIIPCNSEYHMLQFDRYLSDIVLYNPEFMNRLFADKVLGIIQANPVPNSLLGVKELIVLPFKSFLPPMVCFYLTEVETLRGIGSIEAGVPVKRSFMIEYSGCLTVLYLSPFALILWAVVIGLLYVIMFAPRS